MNMDVGMHHAKNRGNKEIPLAILSRILAQSCVTLCLNYVGRVTHDCACILDSITGCIIWMHKNSSYSFLAPVQHKLACI